MKMRWNEVFLLSVCMCCHFLVEGEETPNAKKRPAETYENTGSSEKFVPTSSWQKVEKGQAIPRGMHVRMNIYTGETEAKLLADEKNSDHDNHRTEVAVLPAEDNLNEEIGGSDVSYMSKEDLKRFLAKTIVNEREEDSKEEFQNEKETKGKYRSYEELKKEFDDLNLAVKTEMELLSELVTSGKEKLKQSDEPEVIANVLTDLEYLVHHIDNAQEFIRLGGLNNIILPALNSSVSKVRSEALWLLGSASQSNPKVQIAVLNAGIMHQLLRAAGLDADASVRARAVYSLSCLTRSFPSAQAKLVEEGGLTILGSMFDSEQLADSKTRMKILTLLTDFIQERQDVKKEIETLSYDARDRTNTSDIEEKLNKHKLAELKEKLRQYETINLEKRLKEYGWCIRLPEFLSKLQRNEANADRSQRRNDLGSIVSESLPYRPEHDDVEKVLNTMLTMNNMCGDDFSVNSDLKHVLKQLFIWYQELSVREEVVQKQSGQHDCLSDTCNKEHYEKQDFYYTNMAKTLSHMLKLWETSKTDIFLQRDEL